MTKHVYPASFSALPQKTRHGRLIPPFEEMLGAAWTKICWYSRNGEQLPTAKNGIIYKGYQEDNHLLS
ncbi:MAG: hypothetical protein OSB69_11370, partial [Alphaproteobacteria bacterium]|nr:hypothetical protein [Alphaproteobacteria bacterium]